MADAEFRFTYKPEDGSSSLDAYDASQALYGISRSLSILTQYALTRRIIKQAPSLDGARILVVPPQRGSFEFIVPVIQVVTDPANIQAVAQGLSSSFLYDLTKLVYRRLAGKSETTSSEQIQSLSRQAPGDLDALADTITDDLVRIQRPLISDHRGTFNIVVNGGSMNIVNLDRNTYDFAKTKVLGEHEEEFFGYVRSFNGSTIQGRFWIETEERTVGFSVNRNSRLATTARRTLSWSLDQWVSRLEGFVFITGVPLSSKTGLLKHVFLTGVRRA